MGSIGHAVSSLGKSVGKGLSGVTKWGGKTTKKAAKTTAKATTKAVKQTAKNTSNIATKVTKATTTAVKDTAKATTKAVNQTGKVVEKTAKATTTAVKDTGKAIEKGATEVVNKGIDVGKNFVNSNIKAITDLAKGDIVGSVSNLAGIASYGTIDMSGRKQGIVNIDTKKYVNKALSKLYGKQNTSTSSEIGTAGATETYIKPRSGLLKQLRQARGSAVGGSYSTIAKNPLGGSSGKTGR